MKVNKKLKIWYYANKVPPEHSGSGQRCVNYAKWFKKAGYDVAVITGTRNPDDFNQLTFLFLKNRKPHNIMNQYYNVYALFKDIQDFIHELGKPDIIHSFGGGIASAAISSVCKKFGIISNIELVVTVPANNWKYKLNPNKYIRKFGLLRADQIVANSEGVKNSILNAGINRPVKVINNGVNTQKFQPDKYCYKTELRKSLLLPENGKLLLMVGLFCLRKGHDLATKILYRLIKETNTYLVLVGPYGPKGINDVKKNLTEEEKSILSSDRVIFCGQKQNVTDYYKACDLFLFPSRKEGFPNVLLEAMSSGMMVVSSLIPGITDAIIKHKTNGLLVKDNNNIEEYCHLINKVFADTIMTEQIKKQAVNTVKERFDNELILRQHQEHYEQLFKKANNKHQKNQKGSKRM